MTFNNTGVANGGVDYTIYDADTSTNGILGSAPIFKNGAGTVTFMGANSSYAGAIAINAGQINIQNSNALGSSSGVTVFAGAALQLEGNATSPNISIGSVPLSISGAGVAANPNGALQSVSGQNTYAGAIQLAFDATITSTLTNPGDGLTLSGGLDLAGNNLTINGGGYATISAAVMDSGATPGTLTYSGTGTLTLSAANSYPGLTTINSGTLSIPVGGSLTGSLTYNSGNTSTIAGTLDGYNSILTATNGTLILTGQSTYAGGTQLSGGMLQLGASSSNSFGNLVSGPIGIGELDLNSGGIQDNGSSNSPITIANQVNLNSSVTFSSTSPNTGAASLIFDPLGTSATFSINGGSTSITVNNTTQIDDEMVGSGNVAISGTGTLILTNSNNYSGTMTINSAVVQLNNSNALRSSTVIVNSNGGLTFNEFLGTANLGGLGGTGNVNLLDNFSGGPQPVNLAVGYNGASTEYDGVLSGTGSLTIAGGTLALTGNNTYTGGTILAGGTAALNPAVAGNTVIAPGPVTVNSTSGVSVGGVSLNQTIGDLSIGTSTLNVTSTDTSGSPYSLTFSGSTGVTTLTGSPTFSVSNSLGGGAGTLVLGPLNDGGSSPTITAMGTGTVRLNSPATSLVAGTQVVVAGQFVSPQPTGATATW